MSNYTKAESNVMSTIAAKGKAFVKWEDSRLAGGKTGEVVKTKGKRGKDAITALLERGEVKVVDEESHHNHVARNAKYATTSCFVVVVAA